MISSAISRAVQFLFARTSPATIALTIGRIRAASKSLRENSDTELLSLADELRSQVRSGGKVLERDILVPAFALVCQAFQRIYDITLYDVQLEAGLALAHGQIAQMQTGEGKTFVAALPAFVHSLAGRGVHVMTVNDYLAERDYEQLQPVYALLGARAGLLRLDDDTATKSTAYYCDITYGPGYEFGFDYLRDRLAMMSQPKKKLGDDLLESLRGEISTRVQTCQREHHFAIVDEADSVMLDEATTPLVLSNTPKMDAENANVFQHADQVAASLDQDSDFVINKVARHLYLTEAGKVKAKDAATSGQLNRPWPTYVEQALRARHLFASDEHYVVRDGEVQIVDQYTGRIFADRTWQDGLQQAVEAKEQVTITAENHSVARITRQRYFDLYNDLCGMTGTATGSEREFRDVYRLNVTTIPTNRPCQRKVFPARFFATRAAKFAAILESIVEIHATGQPILIGTTTIADSQHLARDLEVAGITFQLLNGKQDAEEADIVARAGQPNTVTIATNLAGRGTDIKLGPGVFEQGGLHVIATEPQESARVDRQLTGRSARQGDVGSAQLFVSAEDRVLEQHAPALSRQIVAAATDDECRFDFSHDLERLQRKIESHYRTQRRRLYDHDDWLESVLRDL